MYSTVQLSIAGIHRLRGRGGGAGTLRRYNLQPLLPTGLFLGRKTPGLAKLSAA
jgi:hypothetical protein